MMCVTKWSAVVLVGFSVLLLAVLAFCQNKTEPAKQADNMQEIRDLIERVKRNKDIRGEDYDKLQQLFLKPNPTAAAMIITDPEERINIGFPVFLGRFRREEFRQSLLELCDSPDAKLAEHVHFWLVATVPLFRGGDYVDADITDPWLFLGTDRDFIFRYLKDGKELPLLYVNSIYKASPAMSLAAMFYAHHLVQCEHPETPTDEDYKRIDSAYRDVRWVIHLAEVAKWRKEHGFLTPGEIKEVQRKLKWLWDTYPQWWARIYVLILAAEHKTFRYEGLQKDIEKEKHPYLRGLCEALKKEFRGQ